MKQTTQSAKGYISSERPERTRTHYIEALSRNFVEHFIVLQGHTPDEPRPDYGYDIVMTTFDYTNDPLFSSGAIENGYVFLQIKATDELTILKRNEDIISFVISQRHARFWVSEPMPVFLIVYSVQDNEAYWLLMQEYLKSADFRWPKKDQEKLTVHLSRKNVFNEDAVEIFRQHKAKALLRISQGIKLYE